MSNNVDDVSLAPPEI